MVSLERHCTVLICKQRSSVQNGLLSSPMNQGVHHRREMVVKERDIELKQYHSKESQKEKQKAAEHQIKRFCFVSAAVNTR